MMKHIAYDINREGNKFERDTVDFKSLDISEALTAVKNARAAYDTLETKSSKLPALGLESLKGDSAQLINYFMDAIPEYIKAYRTTIDEYECLISDTKIFLDSINTSTTLKTINNI